MDVHAGFPGADDGAGGLVSRILQVALGLFVTTLELPAMIAIIPATNPGVLIVDDVKYDADFCHLPTLVSPPTVPLFTLRPPMNLLPVTSEPDISFTIPDKDSQTPPTTEISITTQELETSTTESTTSESTTTTISDSTTESTTSATTQSPPPTSATKKSTSESEEDYEEEITSTKSGNTETDPPFELYIMGNKTQPLFDRRRGKVIDDTQELLCSFDLNFPCLWGPEAGRWAIIEKGAIPSLEDHVSGKTELPSFPAAVVLQGTAMFASDPVKCQTGSGKLMFRYWANRKIILQVCALGYNLDSNKIQCAEQQTNDNSSENTLAVFDLIHEIHEPFTLNIVPIWERNAQNGYLVLDEIAYMGECNATESSEEEDKRWPKRKGDHKPKQVKIHTSSTSFPPVTTPEEVRPVTAKRIMNTKRPIATTLPSEKESGESNVEEITTTETTTEFTTTYRPPTVTFYPGLVIQRTTLKNSFTIPYTTTVRYVSTTPEPILDYCKLLNCDFNDNACRYLNHGLTKVPWTLRNKGYGFPLSRHTDLRPTPTNGQFVSTILGPGDFAILESPRFNLTQGINVLLFQYYRPTHSSTIRLCLGTRYTKPLRTISSFLQCPPILRSLTSKNALKWNSVHIQLPPGTTHFYLVAHNLERSTEKAAVAIDNIRVAICDPRTFDAAAESSGRKET
ncbi:MAM domain-containing protein [Aphelenchoides bicaudatus]|nr:MAM domain-containing protein [Aphelenchoides bicaudatus]